MKSYDYDAVIYDGMCFCTGCAPTEFTSDKDGDVTKTPITDADLDPIFADSEWDSYPVCEACGEKHEYVNLTSHGLIHEAEAQGAEIFHVSANDFRLAYSSDDGSWHADYMKEAGCSPMSMDHEINAEAERLTGYYVWNCQPGCLPDSDASGPFKTPSDAAASYLNL